MRLGIATGQGHAAMIYHAIREMVGAVLAGRSAAAQLPDAGDRVRRHCSGPGTLGVSPSIGVPRGGLRAHAAGAHGKLPPLGTNCGVSLPARPGMVRASLSARIRPPVRLCGTPCSLDSGRRLDRKSRVPGVAIVGTTIAPWQLFFQQSCIADKRLRFADLKWARLDTLIGATFTIIVAGCMMMDRQCRAAPRVLIH